MVVCPGSDRSLGAAARAGLRIQGHARIRDGGGRGGRRDESRLPAGYRSAARRAGPGRDAEASRALAQPGARLSGRRADRRPQGRRAHRNGRACRGRLRRVLAGGGAADGHRRAAARDAVRRDLRPPRVAAPAGRASRQGRRRARRRGRHAPRPAGDTVGGGDDRAGDDLRAGPRHRRARPPVPAVDGRGRRDGAGGEDAKGCRSPATSPSITCTCATSTSAGSTRNAG